MQSISISEPQVVGVSTPPNYYCPVCRLSTYKPVDNNELEISYRVDGKVQRYVRGWNACPRCLIGAENCVKQYMSNRIDRGISLEVNRNQFEKLKSSDCGCSG